MGIYEIEPLLKNIYGDRLGWVVLKRGTNTYTLRQMDIFMPVTLERVYDRLNFMDAAVKYRDQQNQWGGSVEIGGSPRESGTRLTRSKSSTPCRDAVQNTGFFRQLAHFLGTTALVALIIAAAFCRTLFLAAHGLAVWPPPRHVLAAPAFGMYIGFLLATIVVLVPVAFRRPWQFGLAWPVGKIWWAFLPLAVLGGLAGGSIPFLSLPPAVKPAWGLWLLRLLMAPGRYRAPVSQSGPWPAGPVRPHRPPQEPPFYFLAPGLGAALLFAVYTLWQAPSGVSPGPHSGTPLSLLPPVLGAFPSGWSSAWCGNARRASSPHCFSHHRGRHRYGGPPLRFLESVCQRYPTEAAIAVVCLSLAFREPESASWC